MVQEATAAARSLAGEVDAMLRQSARCRLGNAPAAPAPAPVAYARVPAPRASASPVRALRRRIVTARG